MKNIAKTFLTKKIGVILLVMGTLFAGATTSTFAQGRYHRGLSGGDKAAVIGGTSAAGAVIGALAGGGKGALIGGLIGAGAGTGIVVAKDHRDRDDYYYGSRYYRNDYRYRNDHYRWDRYRR